MKVKCDKCNKEFEITKIKKMQRNRTEIQYFLCTCCKKRYITCCIDSKVKEMQKEFKEIETKITLISAETTIDKELKDRLMIKNMRVAEEKLREMKAYSDTLRDKLQKEFDL